MKQISLIPQPRYAAATAGHLRWPDSLAIWGAPKPLVCPEIIRDLSARPVGQSQGAHVHLLPAEAAPGPLARWAREPEGYGLVVGEEGIRIWARQAAGHFYGLVTLKQLLREYGRRLPCVRIGDAPLLRRRGAMITFPQGHTAYRPAYMKELVRCLAGWKINELYLYLETYFDFPSLPHFGGPGAMTPEDARTLEQWCRAHNMKLIPQLNCLGHCGEILGSQRYNHLMEYSADQDRRILHEANLCASSNETHRLVAGIMADTMDCFSADVIHVGGDEVSMLGECPRCAGQFRNKGKLQIYLAYFDRIRQLAAKRGRKIGIWGDMLLHHLKDVKAKDRQKVLAPLTEGTVIYDWQYFRGSPETLKFFVDAGFETIACSCAFSEYESSPWLGQAVAQRKLFADAAKAGAVGGLTTGWYNYMGLHEEHANYTFAAGAALLWSGPAANGLDTYPAARGFERAYCRQRYDLSSDALTRFWHVLGDLRGPVLKSLAPLHGRAARHCVYHTDNVLTAWKTFGRVLTGNNLAAYGRGLRQARALWHAVLREAGPDPDPYLQLQIGPLLTHEHLLRRMEMSEAVYRLYDQAARVQFRDARQFQALLDRAAVLVLGHRNDFPPIEEYLRSIQRRLGMEKSSLLRVRAAKRKMKDLADYLRHSAKSPRPLPAFIHLHDVLLDRWRTGWYGNREHEWAAEPERFQRYSVMADIPMTAPYY